MKLLCFDAASWLDVAFVVPFCSLACEFGLLCNLAYECYKLHTTVVFMDSYFTQLVAWIFLAYGVAIFHVGCRFSLMDRSFHCSRGCFLIFCFGFDS